ncbi:MAG: phosphatidate cytidylyltransferase, partial [Paracoccaceae bacterium]
KYSNWQDLRPRLVTALVMAFVGGLATWVGGLAFELMILAVLAVMIWELAQMTSAPECAYTGKMAFALGALASLCVFVIRLLPEFKFMALLFVPGIMAQFGGRRLRFWVFMYCFAILSTCFFLLTLRQKFGFDVILWLVVLVAASDIMGYFVGRTLGGPKLWPRVSPKKTWSGTVAGWLGASLVGLVFYVALGWEIELLWLSPLLAMAGQAGDIAQSALKRAVGVKDSSNFLPGHGGFLDRFDAIIFAVLLLSVLNQLMILPF